MLFCLAGTLVMGCSNWSGSPGAERTHARQLAELIDRSDRLIVFDSPMANAPVLYESSGRLDLDGLKAAIRIDEPKGYIHCMCFGAPAIVFYAGRERIGELTNHHGHLLRCNLWESDAPICDLEAFLKWFDDRAITSPRDEWNDAIARQGQSEANRRKWVHAMPDALKPLWRATEEASEPIPVDIQAWHRALGRQIASEHDQIRALFDWFGSGAGPWSGFPSYEQVAEELLLAYPTDTLLTAIDGRQLTASQTEGAARLFGGWHFWKQRRQDLLLLPPSLKRALLEHSIQSPDEDKRRRAERAFEST